MSKVYLIVFERLPVWHLGCYGSFDDATPSFDDVASQSAVFDQAFISNDGVSWHQRMTNSGLDVSHVRIVPEAADDDSGAIEIPVPRILSDQDSCTCFPEEAWDSEVVLCEVCDLEPVESELDREIEEPAPVSLMDTVLHRLLQILLLRLTDDDLLIVTAESGDPGEDPSDNPLWLKSVGESATHLPLIIHAIDPDSVGRFSPFVLPEDVLELIRLHQSGSTDGLRSWSQRLDRDAIRYSSREAEVLRTRNWVIAQRTSPAPDAGDISNQADPVVRLFRQPEDPWLVSDVSGEHHELMERFRQHQSLS